MERKKIAFFRKVKNLWKKAFEFIEYPRIAFKILINRYLIFSFVSFIIMYKFVFGEMNSLESVRYYCAVAVLGFVVIFLGKRGVLYSYFICLGFFVSLICFKKDWNVGFLEIFLISVFSVCFVIGKMYNDKKVKEKIISEFKSEKDLYPKRLDSFNAILEYISNHSVIGIDSPYGNGKSTVVEVLRRKKQDWEFITIGILSTTLENVEFCIIREINRVLESYGVFSNPISKVKSFFSHDFAYCVGDFLFESQSYEEQIRNYVDDIQGIRKVIVLNFEDIDRITNIEHLNKIFAICDSLLKIEAKHESGKQYIKVIYQYSSSNIDKMFKDKYGQGRYTDKFIPHSIRLSVLTGDYFQSVLAKNPEKYDKIKDFKFDFLSKLFVQKLLQQKNLRLELEVITVRAIERILDKVNFAFKLYENQENDKALLFEMAVISNITRYFFPYIYNELVKGVLMDEQTLFHYYHKGNEYVLSLIELRKNIKENFERASAELDKYFDETQNKKAQDNKNALIILSLLGYDDDYYGYDGYKTDVNLEKENVELFDKMAKKSEIFLSLMDLH